MLLRVSDASWQPSRVPGFKERSRLGTVVSVEASKAAVQAQRDAENAREQATKQRELAAGAAAEAKRLIDEQRELMAQEVTRAEAHLQATGAAATDRSFRGTGRRAASA